MSKPSKAGIETTADGASYIPSSKRADGSTRKEIRVRPGYRPPEDVETYKNRSAEAWKNRGQGGVPGAEPVSAAKDDATTTPSTVNKNAKRREAARKKAAAQGSTDDEVTMAMKNANISDAEKAKRDWRGPSKLAANESAGVGQEEADQQKKIRNQLKKLKAVRELREKRAAGEKLSHDQIMKIGKEGELLRDLKKMGYDGPEVQAAASETGMSNGTTDTTIP
ncbi:hypothetical protein A1O1_03896 [Capronia coronata CBS 617.96]|uniref:WIBG Mago-binding domain-containing protein n=1 Tax=Capronia coronata CBS 617.96 TaxID=1182541 RepID=W9YD32_9EURO|nr:uncharacterized protein A1O1_03896 [Capronia coronata CBS 617.96]EXJ90792.1 hypothetical protein A1O1_03896 [Capronia coronata CBS 617.96]